MPNLSQLRRQKMLEFLSKIKEEHKDDDDTLIALGEIENELTSKKYGLVWEKHEEAVDVKMRTHIPVFTEVKEREIDAAPGESYNFLLEGDNLHSLYLLGKTHKGRIDVIYIDPPYNTGNKDFTYDDKYIDEEDAFRHSKWLSFMEERLRIAQKLLADRGVGVNIDDKQYVMVLSDEEADELQRHWNEYQDIKAIYISRKVLLTTEQNMLFGNTEIHIIPDDYFEFELKEEGQAW